MQKITREKAKPDSLLSLAHQEGLLYEFDCFTIDAENHLLMRDGEPVPLTAKAFEILLVLAENHGRVLEKNDLLNRIWPDTFVEEINLNVHISNLRKALGETAASQQYIETIPKKGYRFTAKVKTKAGDQAAGSSLPENQPFAPATLQAVEPLAALRQEPAEAYQAVSEIDEVGEPTVEQIAAAATDGALPGRKRVDKKWRTIAIALALVAALAITAGLLYSKRKEIFSTSTKPFQKMTKRKLTASGKNAMPALSPNGEYVAYVNEDSGKQSLWVMQVATTSCVPVTTPAEVTYGGVTFSPDGSFIYYNTINNASQQGALYQIPILGGVPRKVLCDVTSPISFSPDGKQLAYVKSDLSRGETSLIVACLNGNTAQVLATHKKPELFSNWGGVAWSPDGKVIACVVRKFADANFHMQVATVRLEDGKETALGSNVWGDVGQIAWQGDNSGVLINAFPEGEPSFGFQLWHLSYPLGEATSLTNDLISYEGASLANHSKSFVTSSVERISRMWVAADGNSAHAKQINSTMGDNYSESFGMDWTPDGKIVYGSYGGTNADIWLMNADGTSPRRLTFTASSEAMPVVSPDGTSIVFSLKDAQPSHLWRMDSNGDNLRQLTYGLGENNPCFSPDGKWIIYNSFTSESMTLTKVSVDGGEPVQLTHKWSIRPVVSPDGKLIACFQMDEERKQMVVALVPFAGGEPVKILKEMPMPDSLVLRWSRDGRAIQFVNTLEGVSNIWSQPIDGGNAKPLTDFKTERIFRFAWSRDGKKLALDRGVTISDIILITDGK